MVNSLGIIVQAHMGSTRLKNKMMKNLFGKSVLGHVITRLKRSLGADKLIVATSNLPTDDILVEECEKYQVDFYRGSDSDVLERFYQTAKRYELTDIARVCADNTLIDWHIIDEEIEIYKRSKYDIVTCGDTVPLGLGCEIFSFELLEKARNNAKEYYQHEHVTPYLYENFFNVYKYNLPENFKKYRFTLDTEKDWQLISKIYAELYHGENDFLLTDVITAMKKNPDWFDINKDVKQKMVRESF